MLSEPWTWSETGADRLSKDLRDTGFSRFVDPSALERSADPIALAERLFGQRPYRYQRMEITPDPAGLQRSLPNTMMEGELHNDCAFPVIPPHVQVMLCVRPAARGGESWILDLWPIVERIEQAEPDLFEALFNEPRVFVSGHAPLFGTTFSLQRGSVVATCPSLSTVRGDTVGARFRQWIMDSEVATFLCGPGEVYVNDNHRSLHGRAAFDDPNRLFIRLLYWFPQPFAAPPSFVEAAKRGGARLAESLRRRPRWVRRRFGSDSPAVSPELVARAADLLQRMVAPTNMAEWEGTAEVMRQQEILLSLLEFLNEPVPRPEEQRDILLRVLGELSSVTVDRR